MKAKKRKCVNKMRKVEGEEKWMRKSYIWIVRPESMEI